MNLRNLPVTGIVTLGVILEGAGIIVAARGAMPWWVLFVASSAVLMNVLTVAAVVPKIAGRVVMEELPKRLPEPLASYWLGVRKGERDAFERDEERGNVLRLVPADGPAPTREQAN